MHHLDGDHEGPFQGQHARCAGGTSSSLCQRCHLQIQGKVKMERVYPWPHSEWFRPYVAGYYAWTYLGEEITRAEAAAATTGASKPRPSMQRLGFAHEHS
jgi:hypothetical protein